MTNRAARTADVTAAHAGCWLDGRDGPNLARLARLAAPYGALLSVDDVIALTAYEDGRDRASLTGGVTVDARERTEALAARAHAWLNLRVAPEGHVFGWVGQEYHLMPVA